MVGLAGVLSGSASWAIMAAFGLWVAQWLVSFHDLLEQLTSSKLVSYIMKALYYLFPKTDQLGDMAVSLALGQPVESWLPLWSALLFSAAMMFLAVWVFRRRDY